MLRVHSEQISRRLFISMLIIVLSLLCISIPLIINSYKEYREANYASTEIEALSSVADLVNKISRERGPANMAMSSNASEIEKNMQGLIEYRAGVDQQIKITSEALKKADFESLIPVLENHLVKGLIQGREKVDAYIATPYDLRKSEQLDLAILTMFDAWDSGYDLLKKVVMASKSRESSVGNYYTLILILADLRDQAGRVASNVTAHVTFDEPLPNDNVARSLQTQKQVRYLWDLVNVIQPEKNKTKEFVALHQEVKSKFIDQGMPIIMRLIDESNRQKPYYLSGTELSAVVSDKFLTVINLQKYLLEYSNEIVKKEEAKAKQKFLTNLSISIISLMAALFTMIYAQRKVFAPLIEARDMIVQMSYAYSRAGSSVVEHEHLKVYSLYDALQKLQQMLKQRDAFEFELKSIANTDKLTGVSNRVALEEYLKFSDIVPNHFEDVCLIVIDIDNFKTVNDQHGHVFGDEVIVSVANCLKQSVRNTDLIVRFGGDEFLIVLENVELEHGLNTAEKIRSMVSQLDLVVAETQTPIKASVSIGVGVGAKCWKELLEKADKALYESKAKGKNSVSGSA